MAVSRVKTSSVLQGFAKYRTMLAGNSAYIPPSFESIATATGTGSSANILFSSIPQTYKHLQVRILGRSDDTSTNAARSLFIQCNSDYPSTSVYGYHELSGNGTSASASAALSFPTVAMYSTGTSQSTSTNTMGVFIVDIHNYTNTSQYKTVRTFGGVDFNGSGTVSLSSGLYQSTSAITALRLSINTGSWSTNTTIALYGIKG